MNEEEPNRVLGMPRSRAGHGRQGSRQGEEPQHALGLPVDWFRGVDTEFFRSLLHPIRGYRRWSERRRLGPYAPEDDGPRRG